MQLQENEKTALFYVPPLHLIYKHTVNVVYLHQYFLIQTPVILLHFFFNLPNQMLSSLSLTGILLTYFNLTVRNVVHRMSDKCFFTH